MKFVGDNLIANFLLSRFILKHSEQGNTMKFVAFSRDWADEMTVYGFALMTTEEWNDYSEVLKKRTSVSWYFGTNEGYDDDSGQDFLDNMEVTDITSEEADMLKRIFKLKKYSWDKYLSWGHFPEFDPEEDEDGQDEW